MEPTLKLGDTVLVDTKAYADTSPAIGDVVAFHPPRDAVNEVCGRTMAVGTMCNRPEATEGREEYVKRIVAGPRDLVAMVNGDVIRNGQGQRVGTIQRCTTSDSNCSFPKPSKIPPGMWFMLGDNRGQSNDSRYWGPIPTSWIIGKVIGR
jgi:signal peptidase I